MKTKENLCDLCLLEFKFVEGEYELLDEEGNKHYYCASCFPRAKVINEANKLENAIRKSDIKGRNSEALARLKRSKRK